MLLRGYGGLCLTRPNIGPGPVTMETCTGTDTQLWRLDPGDTYASMRFKSETGNLCLAAKRQSMSSVVAEVCDGSFQVHLPLVVNQLGRASAQDVTAADVAPQSVYGVQDFYLTTGGQIRLPSRAGSTPYCLDVQDVWDSEFISGKGGPEPGQRVQTFECLTDQLNQRWNLSGDIMSGFQCLTLSGDATHNGANATVQTLRYLGRAGLGLLLVGPPSSSARACYPPPSHLHAARNRSLAPSLGNKTWVLLTLDMDGQIRSSDDMTPLKKGSARTCETQRKG